MRFLLVSLLLLPIAALSACGGDSDDDGDGDASPAATSAGSSSPVAATSTATADPEETPGPMLLPGEFTSKIFKPAVRVTLDEGWRLVVDSTFELVFERDDPDPANAGYVGVFRVTNVKNENNFSENEPVPDALIAWFSEHKDLMLTEGPAAVTVSDVSGTQADFRIDTNYNVPLFDLYVSHFRERVRFIELDVPGERILLASGAFNWSYFDEFKPIMDEVIASIAFE